MTIQRTQLEVAARRWVPARPGSLPEAKVMGLRTAFLCHSHLDVELVKGLLVLLQQSNWAVYVDWQDATMPDQPSRETARRLKARIDGCNLFLFLATSSSMNSRWCPWEIGYADGKKPIDSIIVIPTVSDSATHGSEYLDLYRRIEFTAGLVPSFYDVGSSTGRPLNSL